jgi:hypothetical protein
VIAALYVLPDGPYANLPDVDPWDKARDARLYSGPHPVVAHPPCARWGRYAEGGPSAPRTRKVGDDAGCFAAALHAVRSWGGVLEHPEASHAWPWFGLHRPPRHGGWVPADLLGGWTCCVEQGHYGHAARKATWLYVFGIPGRELPELTWGPCDKAHPKTRLDAGFHSKEERRRQQKRGTVTRLSSRQAALTPEPFAELLLDLARRCSASRNLTP